MSLVYLTLYFFTAFQYPTHPFATSIPPAAHLLVPPAPSPLPCIWTHKCVKQFLKPTHIQLEVPPPRTCPLREPYFNIHVPISTPSSPSHRVNCRYVPLPLLHYQRNKRLLTRKFHLSGTGNLIIWQMGNGERETCRGKLNRRRRRSDKNR